MSVEHRGTRALELWARRATEGYDGVNVNNMTTAWRDGLAFCALIHYFRPDLINFASLKPDVLGNNALAFRVAEKHLSIPALLDAEDMVRTEVPDRLSVLTYVSQFYQAFSALGLIGPGGRRSPTAATPKADQTKAKSESPKDSKVPETPAALPVVVLNSILKNGSPPTPVAAVTSKARIAISQPPSTLQTKTDSPAFKTDKAAVMSGNRLASGGSGGDCCASCGDCVFLAERVAVGVRRQLMHRRCFRCRICDAQLSLAAYEEAQDGSFECERCAEEERKGAIAVEPPAIVKDVQDKDNDSESDESSSCSEGEEGTSLDASLISEMETVPELDVVPDQESETVPPPKPPRLEPSSPDEEERRDPPRIRLKPDATPTEAESYRSWKVHDDAPGHSRLTQLRQMFEPTQSDDLTKHIGDTAVEERDKTPLEDERSTVNSDANGFSNLPENNVSDSVSLSSKSDDNSEDANKSKDIISHTPDLVKESDSDVCHTENKPDIVRSSLDESKPDLVKLSQELKPEEDVKEELASEEITNEESTDITINIINDSSETKTCEIILSNNEPLTETLKDEYPVELNPFGSDDDGSISLENKIPAKDSQNNPFDDESSDKTTKIDEIGKDKRSLNPFGSDDEDEESSVPLTPRAKPPRPPPPTLRRDAPGLGLMPSPNPSCHSSSSDLSHSTLKLKKKSRPAPAPPPITGGLHDRADVSATLSRDEVFSIKMQKDLRNQTSKMLLKCEGEDGNDQDWRRRKGPAPARPVAQRRFLRLATPRLEQELQDIDVKQGELERQGVLLETAIRAQTEGDEGEDGENLSEPKGVVASKGMDAEEMILQLFELVNEKNELFRRQSELMYMKRERRLEQEYVDVEFQIRSLMLKLPSERDEENDKTEEKLISRLVAIVEERDAVVAALDSERRRYVAEDEAIADQMGRYHEKHLDDSGEGEAICDTESIKKRRKVMARLLRHARKKKKKKKQDDKEANKHLSKEELAAVGVDADKDIDETETTVPSLPKLKEKKKKKIWFKKLAEGRHLRSPQKENGES